MSWTVTSPSSEIHYRHEGDAEQGDGVFSAARGDGEDGHTQGACDGEVRCAGGRRAAISIHTKKPLFTLIVGQQV